MPTTTKAMEAGAIRTPSLPLLDIRKVAKSFGRNVVLRDISLQVELKSLQREVGISFLFVTHDQEEAMVMSDRIALLRMGELE